MKKDCFFNQFNTRPDADFPVHICRTEKKEPGPIFDSHWHEQFQLLYFVQGKALIRCNSRELTMNPGDIAIINGNDVHYGESLETDLVFYVFKLDFNFILSSQVDLCQTKYIMPLASNMIVFKNFIGADQRIVQVVEDILREYFTRETGFELAIKAHTYSLLVLLLRGYIEKNLKAREYRFQVANLQRFRLVLEYMETHYNQKVSLSELAAQANLSVHHFCRLFKQYTGKSSQEYLNQLRIKEAVALLNEGKLNVTEVAFATGFNDLNYFCRVFKRLNQISPSSFRK